MRDRISESVKIAVANGDRERTWAKELCAKFRDELGGVHLGILEAHAALGHLSVAHAEGQLVACLVSKEGLASDTRIAPIIAAAVPTDLQRLGVGLALLDRWIARHTLAPDRIVQACCRAGLPSNWFWARAGFIPAFVRSTDAARGRPVIVWRRRVDGGHDGCREYYTPRKPRGGGGRWIPLAEPERQERVSDDACELYAALERSGLGEWAVVGNHLTLVVSGPRPEIQGVLFPSQARSALTNGR